jgi:hypothetical protein
MQKPNFTRSLICLLAFGFALSGILAAPAAADDFQRYVVFYNELPITIYPAITAVESENGAACGTTGALRRIIVNAGKLGAGIPSGQTVTVSLPKTKHCWYSAVRVYLFTVDLTKFEARIPAPDRTVPDGITWNPPLCAAGACSSGTAVAQYPVDAPAQLFEYTVISVDPATGDAFPDPNNVNGIALADIDISYVDEAYLPVAANVDDGGATAMMGTAQPYALFNQRTQAFLDLKNFNKSPIWSQFGAYTTTNYPFNVFHDLVSRTSHIVGKDIVSDIRIVPPNLFPPLSALYTPPYTGPQQCSAVPMCSDLSGNCCPTSPPNPVILDCCGAPAAYLLSNTMKMASIFVPPPVDNPSVDDLVARWTKWVRADPCATLANISEWPSTQPEFSKTQFCSAFRQTAIFVWNSFYNSANQVDPITGKPIPYTGCINFTGADKDQCTVDAIIAFKSTDKGVLNQSVQALLRNVPYGSFTQTRYSFDKFLLFWPSYGSIFNLFPYARLVHSANGGVDAPGAYSFSIDDRFGNFQSRGSGFIIDIGGSTKISNRDPYDFWEQYRVSFAKGWDHATVCGHPFAIPGKLGAAAPISFWLNGVPTSSCDVVLYKDAAGTQYAKFQVGEESKQVTDIYTGLTKTVTQLKWDSNYCPANSTPALVMPPVSVCTNSNLAFTGVAQPTAKDPIADPGEAYVSLSDPDKPLVTLTIPQPVFPPLP